MDPAALVFVDETATSLRPAPLRGRAPRGARCDHVTDLTSYCLVEIGPSILLPDALDRQVLDRWSNSIIRERE